MSTRAISLMLVGALLLSLVGTVLISTPASAATFQVRAWTKNATAVLAGDTGKFDANGALGGSVINDGGTYKMWYTGRTATGLNLGIMAIGYATSGDSITWIKQNSGNAVLEKSSTASDFDSRGVAFPTVIKDGSTYKMWYTGYSGGGANTVSKIGYATSSDGIIWNKSTSNPVLSPVASTWEAMGVGAPNVIKDSSTYKMWYTGVTSNLQPNIGYATSSNGTAWSKSSSNPVLAGGVGGASVIKDSGSVYRMWYTSQDSLGVYRIGYASSNNGTNWAKATAPALTAGLAFEASGVAAPSVVKKTSGVFEMWYTGVDASNVPRLGYATPDASIDTIAEVIAAASAGDTIIVHPGTYPEQVNINKANLIVKSWDVAALPIIDATGYDPAVVISATGTTFKGFGFTGASNRGVRITSAVTTGTTTIYFNNIEGTALFPGLGSFDGVVNEGAGTLVAYSNYWGNASGPAGIGEGSGSALLGAGTYESWLTRDVLTVLQDNLGYLGWNASLGSGWNVLSAPVALDSAADTYGELVALGNGLKIHPTSPAYYYDGATQTWTQVTSTYVLSPVNAIYIKMTDADKAPILASASVSSPQKSLSAGWNLVGPSTTDAYVKASTALQSVAAAFVHLVSPALNQTGWVYTTGDTIAAYVNTTTAGWMHQGKGYWAYMNSADTMGGFGLTPLASPVPSSW